MVSTVAEVLNDQAEYGRALRRAEIKRLGALMLLFAGKYKSQSTELACSSSVEFRIEEIVWRIYLVAC